MRRTSKSVVDNSVLSPNMWANSFMNISFEYILSTVELFLLETTVSRLVAASYSARSVNMDPIA
jgi:hypothetical protein